MIDRKRPPRSIRTAARHLSLESLESRRLMSTITYNGTSGNDTFVLKAAGPNDTIVYNGKGGHDSIKIESTGSVGTIFAGVKLLNSNGGDWAVDVNNLTAGNKRTVAVAGGKVTGVTNGVVDFSATSLRKLSVNVLGGAGSTAAIDQALAKTLNTFNLPGTWVVNVGGATGKLDGIKNPVQINATSDNSDLRFNDLSDTSDRTITLTGGELAGLSAKPIAYTGFGVLKILTGSGDKTVAIKGTTALTTFTSFDGHDKVTVGDNGSFDKLTRTLNLRPIYGKTDLTFDRSKDTADRSWEIDDHTVTTSGVNGVLTYAGDTTVRVLTGSGKDKVIVNNTNANEFALKTGGGDDRVTIFAATGHATIDTGTHPTSTGFSDNVTTSDGTKGNLSWFLNGLTVKNAGIAGFSDLSDWTPHHYTVTPTGLVRDGVQVVSYTGEKQVAVLGGGGNDFMDAYGYDKSVFLEGVAGDDFIRGSTHDDNLEGKLGNDTLVGGGGTDLLFGNEGADLLNVTGNNQKTKVDGGSGFDTMRSDGMINTVISIETLKFPGLVSGAVFDDANKNGLWNASEKGKAGVQVWIDLNHSGAFDAGDTAAVTDSAGKYLLRDIDPGTFSVNVLPPFGSKQTNNNAKPYVATFTTASWLTGYNFGVAKK